ncbi:Nn.00g028500.m01.CDS01 [Neocucurbitaria sp. VM-36]
MAQPTEVDELCWRVEQCEKDDKKRQELFKELLSKLKVTTEELEKVRLDLEVEASARRRLQQQNKELLSKTVKPYVLVIIDADGYHFLRTNEGEGGGKFIADKLVAVVKDHLESIGKDLEQCDIVVETYANTEGLGQAMVARGQVRSIEELRLFWTGFVCRQRMFAHVDVGRGKENADQRIRERVYFHSGIWQCKRVFLACCHDEGYATFLGQFVSTGKVTLLKNEVCHPKLEALGLPIVEFPGLFVQPVALQPLSPEVVTLSTGRKALQNPFALQSRLGPVLNDKKNGLRYDRPLNVKVDALKNVERIGLCFWFYLTGGCKGCDRVHDKERRLTVDDFDALWLVARRGECYKSQKRRVCNDMICIYGHKS